MREQVPTPEAPLQPLFAPRRVGTGQPPASSAASRAGAETAETRDRRDWMERLLEELDQTPDAA